MPFLCLLRKNTTTKNTNRHWNNILNIMIMMKISVTNDLIPCIRTYQGLIDLVFRPATEVRSKSNELTVALLPYKRVDRVNKSGLILFETQKPRNNEEKNSSFHAILCCIELHQHNLFQ